MRNTIKRLEARGGSGFTLIELLVVIAILAILSGVVVFAVGNSTANAKIAACETERGSIITAWNAAYTSNQIDGNAETYTDYLDSGLEYFAVPTNAGAARAAATLPDSPPAADCAAITDAELQDI